MEARSSSDFKKQLRVQFIGEEAVDEGGVQKEFFQLVVREMFEPKYGMFSSDPNSRLCWFAPQRFGTDPATLDEFKLTGLVIGLAIYNGVILNLNFPLAMYKKLLGKKVRFSDLKELNPVSDVIGDIDDACSQSRS